MSWWIVRSFRHRTASHHQPLSIILTTISAPVAYCSTNVLRQMLRGQFPEFNPFPIPSSSVRSIIYVWTKWTPCMSVMLRFAPDLISCLVQLPTHGLPTPFWIFSTFFAAWESWISSGWGAGSVCGCGWPPCATCTGFFLFSGYCYEFWLSTMKRSHRCQHVTFQWGSQLASDIGGEQEIREENFRGLLGATN